MWDKPEIARILVLAALVAVTWLLLWPRNAAPAAASTPRDAERIAWYLKGQVDALFPARGWQTLSLACTPRPDKWVSCDIRVRVGRRGLFCDHALYLIRGFGIYGHTASPTRCTPRS